ncbi:MAG: hypothetical protein JRH20_10450 [Deltaproteobacteria bacterium]|nr:hypothetical protein [Deltaproteobacteria bacterium]
MLTYRSWLGMLMAGALVMTGCSDDSGPSGTDAGGDVTVLADGSDVVPDGPIGGETAPQVDSSIPEVDGTVPETDATIVPNTCEAVCLAEAAFLCLEGTIKAGTDEERTGCLECTTNAHCEGNPNSFGATCNVVEGWCTCADDTECAGNPNGKVCDEDYSSCSCTTNSECPTGKVCTLDVALGLMACEDTCTDNADCQNSETPFCDTRDGGCVACLTDGDCTTADAPFCAEVDGEKMCVECSENTQCAGSKYGEVCDENYCTCTEDAHCAHDKAWGGACVEHESDYGTFAACGCTKDDNSECATNAYGTTCNMDYSVCGCAGNDECSDTEWTTCGLVVAGDTFARCQAACTEDADCTAVNNGLNACDTTSGTCIPCKTTADCAEGVCDTNSNACVECLTSGDCSEGKPHCLADNSCGECIENAHCADATTGAKCGDNGSCGCAVDGDCGVDANGPTCDGADANAGKLGSCSCVIPDPDDPDAAPDACGTSGNTRGKVCQEYVLYGYLYFSGCGCDKATDDDCIDGKKCGSDSAYVMWNTCQDPCNSNDDCQGDAFGVCESELCIGCANNDDCTYTPYESVCSTTSICIECKTSADCGAASLGPICAEGDGWCGCETDTDCVGNVYGLVCNEDLAFCSCNPADSAGTCPTGKTCTDEIFGVATCK